MVVYRIDCFTTKEFKEYKAGNPYKAVRLLRTNLRSLKTLGVKMKQNLKIAGEHLEPGMKHQLRQDIKEIFRSLDIF